LRRAGFVEYNAACSWEHVTVTTSATSATREHIAALLVCGERECGRESVQEREKEKKEREEIERERGEAENESERERGESE